MSTQLTGPNGGGIYVPGKVRTTQSPLFDTYSIASAAAIIPGGLYKHFGAIQGLGGVTPQMTNMSQAFQLSGGESFLVKSMRLVPLGVANADWVAFCQSFTVRLIAGSGSTIYAEAPAEYWCGGAGISGPTSDVNNGVPDPNAIVPFNLDPLPLTDGINFRVEIVGTSPGNATAAFFYRVYLDGQRTAGAQ
jgi:hypothetical protein